MSFSLEIIISFMVESPSSIWEVIHQSHKNILHDDGVCDFSGSNCKVKDVPTKIKISKRPDFSIIYGGGEIQYGHVKNYDHSFVHSDGLFSDLSAASSAVYPFLCSSEFIQAMVYDKEFEFWQNAEDPLEYEDSGRSIAGLPMKSNGLPFPLEKTIIDISKNPSRRLIRDGYIEAIGSRMWLGPEFFQRVPKASRQAILSASWLEVSELESGILEIRPPKAPFVDLSTADTQNRLRHLLFPE